MAEVPGSILAGNILLLDFSLFLRSKTCDANIDIIANFGNFVKITSGVSRWKDKCKRILDVKMELNEDNDPITLRFMCPLIYFLFLFSL